LAPITSFIGSKIGLLEESAHLVVALTQNIEARLESLVSLILKEVTKGPLTMLDAAGGPAVSVDVSGQPSPPSNAGPPRSHSR